MDAQGTDGDGIQVTVRDDAGKAVAEFWGQFGPSPGKFWYTSGGSKIVGSEQGDGVSLSSTTSSWKASWRRPSPKEVVQTFYIMHHKLQDERSSRNLLLERAGLMMFEYNFQAKLKSISNNGPNDKVWFDFDPFIAGQMNSAEHRVGAPQVEGTTAFVPVEVSYRAPGYLQHAVKVELKKNRYGWQIVNFHYPAEGDVKEWDLKGWIAKSEAR